MTLTPREKAKQRADAKRPAVTAWKSAALQDGWTAEPLYTTESVDTVAKLTRDGWTAYVFLRERGCSITVWAPDELQVRSGEVYSGWDALQRLVTVCPNCNAEGPTVRIGFAGRCCPDCRKVLGPKLEYPGWAD